jgi:putative PIN family toxin of toxin-antitoxin system
MNKIILDTNVLYAGLYSSRGASFKVLQHLAQGRIGLVLSTTLLFEYEELLKRHQAVLKLTLGEIDAYLDDLCRRSEYQRIHFLWRPQLSDPKDDHVLELAVAAGRVSIVTHNTQDFVGAKPFGVKILTPRRLLEELR